MITPEEILILEIRRVKVKEMLEYLTEHDKHGDRRDSNIAWNIKVYSADQHLKDKKLRKEYNLKGKWDKRWQKELENNNDLFWNCCEDGLDFVGDTNGKRKPYCPWTTKEGDEFDYEIWQAGRCGGWLELHFFEGRKVDLSELEGMYEQTTETEDQYCCRECEGHFVEKKEGWSTKSVWERTVCHDSEQHKQEYYYDFESNVLGYEDWLEKLVRFCKSLDEFDANKELEHQLAFRRQELESEWAEERKSA